MLILLPPSEGKRVPRRGSPLRPDAWPAGLAAPREQVLAALVRVCRGDEDDALRTLGVGLGQRDEVRRNAELLSLPTARADTVYTGVLYEALDLASLSQSAKRRATGRLLVTSSLFGVVRPDERIPAYRLSGDVTLPGLGTVAGHWREHLDAPVRAALGTGLLVDLRSGTYAAFWRPGADLARRTATVRVLHESDGKRSVVSHFNKATKGRIVRALLEQGGTPRTPAALARTLGELGWNVEVGAPTKHGVQLDVVVTAI
ncbi:MAG: hypothetical protein JWO46_74 [Nocardioidaceae bacterium]|nr:hypothetical protein [Nocardioidaceae bacterium]